MKNIKQRSIGIWIWSILFIACGTFTFCGFFLSLLSNEFVFYYPLTIYSISLFCVIEGIGIFFLKNWARLIAVFLGLIAILSSFTYLLTRPGETGIIEDAMGHWGNPSFKAIIILCFGLAVSLIMATVSKKRILLRWALRFTSIFISFLIVDGVILAPHHFEANFITLLWFGLALSSILAAILQKRILLHRMLLVSSTFFFFFVIIISRNYWFAGGTAMEVIIYLMYPVISGLIPLAFFCNSNVREQFRVSFRMNKKSHVSKLKIEKA